MRADDLREDLEASRADSYNSIDEDEQLKIVNNRFVSYGAVHDNRHITRCFEIYDNVLTAYTHKYIHIEKENDKTYSPEDVLLPPTDVHRVRSA